MTVDVALSLLTFALVSSLTPGPNNFMLLASGANFGFVRTIPHALGIMMSFFVLLVAIGFGLGALLTAAPALHLALKIAGASYLVYLAWRLAMSRSLGQEGQTNARPMTPFEAALFQWVNPKAWVMGLTSMAVFTDPDRPFMTALIVAFTFFAVNFPSNSIWIVFGVALRRLLADPVRLKWFNITMAVLLILSVVPMLG